MDKNSLRKKAEALLAKSKQKQSSLDTQQLIHELGTHQIELEMQNEELLANQDKLNKTQNQLEASLKMYTHLYDSAPCGYLTLDPKMNILKANLMTAALLGVTRDRLIGENITAFIAPEDQGKTQIHYNQARQSRQISEFKAHNCPLHLRFETITDDLDPRQHQTIIIDITELKSHRDRMEELVKERTASLESACHELQLKEAALSTFFSAVDQSSSAIVVTDIDGNIEYVNQSFCALNGYSANELLGNNMRILKSGAHSPEFIKSFWDTINSGTTWKGHWCNKKKAGALYWANGIISPVKDASGKITHFVETKEDITLAKRQDEEIQKLSMAVTQSSSSVLITDENGKIEYVNPAFCAITGYKLDEIMGRTPAILRSGKHPQWFYRNLWKTIKAGREWKADVCNRKKNGELYWELQSIHPILDHEGKIINFLSMRIDDTERKIAEEKLKHYAKELRRSNQDLEDFASIASHDLQEPLRKIIAFGDRIVAKENDLQEESKDYLERMQKASARMQNLIEDLLRFSKVNNKSQHFEPVDLGKIIDEVKDILEFKIDKLNGTITETSMPCIEADPHQMLQLFQNIMANALKFHREGIPPHILVESRRHGTNGWEITIKDNGIGFDEKYAERIFKPFERLHGKSAYEGTGIGLAICKRIVERHNGTIIVKSVLGEGSSFVITLLEKQFKNDI